MTTDYESSIFDTSISDTEISDTGAPTSVEAWPLQEDVLDEHAWLGEETDESETEYDEGPIGDLEYDETGYDFGDAEYDETSDDFGDGEFGDAESGEVELGEIEAFSDESSTDAGRLVVERHPLLASHRGTPPDAVVKWNRLADEVDVVVHLHGFSGKAAAMNLVRDKEPRSGLDFADPTGRTSTPGRAEPTVLVLPRGHHRPTSRNGYNAMRYTFPDLVKPGALQAFVDDALRRVTAATGVPVRQKRLILTAHSGGGAALMAILAHTDPDEVHTFDALYNDPSRLVEWARRRIASGTGALRVLYRPREGTAANSERVAAAVRGAASPRFRVDRTTVAHDDIPARFGWALLANPAAEPAPPTKHREIDEYADEETQCECGRGSESLEEWVDEEDEARKRRTKQKLCGLNPPPVRRKLGRCIPVQDDCVPEAPWPQMQQKFRALCSVHSARGVVDCLCALGDPRDVAWASMAPVVAAGPLALRLFSHFLGASGTEMTIDVADMLARSSGVRAKIRASIGKGGVVGTTRIEQSEYHDRELQFAYGAIDCVQWRVVPPVPKNWRQAPDTTIEVSMLDYYEFHPARTAVSRCAHAACVELVARGRAKNFWTSGTTVTTWGALNARGAAPTEAVPTSL